MEKSYHIGETRWPCITGESTIQSEVLLTQSHCSESSFLSPSEFDSEIPRDNERAKMKKSARFFYSDADGRGFHHFLHPHFLIHED
jgi:hypothetical protein